MKKTEIATKVSRKFNKLAFSVKKHSPEILVTFGVVGTVASAIMACKATTKISTILDNTKKDLEPIHRVQENKEFSEEYTQDDAKKELAIVYAQTGVRFVKLYAPSVILGALSLTSILASSNILRKRNVALAAAYATVDRGFKEYRNRVIERFGEEIDRELKYNIKAKEIEEKITDENGNEKTVKKNLMVTGDPNQYSDYARFFDDGCTGWEKDSEYNLMFLRSEQNYANDRLKARGYLFLNEVYERLGIKPTKAGQAVGWIYDPNNPKHKGDNYVDFGIYEVNRERARAFVNGYEQTILLDFNVDGPILDSIEKLSDGVN